MFKMNKVAAAVGVAALAIGAGAAQAARIDPFGLGGAGGVYEVNNFGWNNGNSISTPINTSNGTVNDTVVGDTIETFGMAKLQGLNDANGDTFAINNFNPNAWSYVFGFAEEVVTATTGITSSGRVFRTIANPNTANFFEIWVGGTAAADLTGKGFNGDGGATRILWGEVLPYNAASGDGQTSFDSSSATLVQFDQNGTNNYATYSTVTGTGGGKIDVRVDGVNSGYFLDNVALLNVELVTDTFQNLPYSQVNPASCFWDGSSYISGAGNGITGGCGVIGDGGSISLINGIYNPSYTNVMFQTRATTTLPTVVPEPGTLALLGLGLLVGVSFCRRQA